MAKYGKLFFLITILAIFLSQALNQEAFALRTLKKGDLVKDFELPLVTGEGPVKLSELAGKSGLVMIFWATWSERSKSLLKFAETELKQQFADKGITFVGVNVEGESVSDADLAKIRGLVEELGISFPVAVDEGLVVFDEIGVITNPTTVLVGESLKMEGIYPGFPSIARDEIPKMVNSYLGIAEERAPIRVQYLLDHQPKNKALLRYNLGRNLYKRYLSLKGELKNVPAGAVKQLDEAMGRDPDFYAPYILKAIIYHKTGEDEEKQTILKQIEEKDFKEHVERIDIAYMYILIGMSDKAKAILTGLHAEIPGEQEVKLLDAAVLLSENRGEDARPVLADLAAQEKENQVFPFDITEFERDESKEIKRDAHQDSFFIAEKMLNISKK